MPEENSSSTSQIAPAKVETMIIFQCVKTIAHLKNKILTKLIFSDDLVSESGHLISIKKYKLGPNTN